MTKVSLEAERWKFFCPNGHEAKLVAIYEKQRSYHKLICNECGCFECLYGWDG